MFVPTGFFFLYKYLSQCFSFQDLFIQLEKIVSWSFTKLALSHELRRTTKATYYKDLSQRFCWMPLHIFDSGNLSYMYLFGFEKLYSFNCFLKKFISNRREALSKQWTFFLFLAFDKWLEDTVGAEQIYVEQMDGYMKNEWWQTNHLWGRGNGHKIFPKSENSSLLK